MTHSLTHASSRPRFATLALALFFCAGLAQAQYVWIGPNGTRHYSDQPPPPDTPAAKILKTPGRAAPAQLQEGTPPTANEVLGTQAAPAAKKPPTLAERDADFRKRAKEREQAEQKTQDEAKAAAARTERCAELAKAKRLYESGVRVNDMDANGKSRIMTDAERAERVARANTGLADCR